MNLYPSKNINISNNNSKVFPITFNPFLPEFHQNPYPFYDRLRTHDPVHKSFLGFWVITRYADVKAILRDNRFRSDEVPKQISAKSQCIKKPDALFSLTRLTSKWLFFLDPPDHTRIRALLSKVFSIKMIDSLRPKIQETVDDLLKKVFHQGKMNIINDFSCPLPVVVIAKMLGIPSKDYNQLNYWSNVLSHILDPLLSLADYEEMDKAAAEFENYLRKLILTRQKNPQNDLISELIEVRDKKEALTEEELLATCMVLFVTGEETVVSLIANGMSALLQNPDQMEILKNDPSLIKNAVEELLRFDSPLQQTARIANENIQIKNNYIRAGEKVLLLLGSANRDPDQFFEPDKLIITRKDIQHLGYGGGIHNCLGISLARVQAQIAINSLLQQLPSLRLDSKQLEWQPHIALRRLKALPIVFNPSPSGIR